MTCDGPSPVLTITSSTGFGRSSKLLQNRALQIVQLQFGHVAVDGGFIHRLGRSDEVSQARQGCPRPSPPTSRRRGSERGNPCSQGYPPDQGTAKTSRFCSIAWRAVMSDPLRGAASTITTPKHSPEMIAIPPWEQLRERSLAHGHLGHNATRRRRSRRRARRARAGRFPTGRWPSRRSFGRPLSRAPRWAAPSIPLRQAGDDRDPDPSQRSRQALSAIRTPYGVHFREPTRATAILSSG